MFPLSSPVPTSFIVIPASPIVVPAKAGTQDFRHSHKSSELGACVLETVWISACAEMTTERVKMTMGKVVNGAGKSVELQSRIWRTMSEKKGQQIPDQVRNDSLWG